MKEKPKFLGVIPAKGISKRLPNKNMRQINGKPLLYWTIKYAKESKLLDDIVLSTEDKEIKEYAKQFYIEVLDRPKELSEDKVSMIDVLKHVAEKYPYDYLVLLQPTNPIRTDGLIDRCIQHVINLKADTLATGFKSTQYEWTNREHDPLGPLSEKKGWFYNDGTVEIHSRNNILEGFPFGKKILKMNVEEKYHIDIDTRLDLVKADAIMRYLGMEP